MSAMSRLLEPVRPVLDVGSATPRRTFLALMAAGGFLAGCGQGAPPTSSTRPVEGDFGTVEIPVRPQRVAVTYTEVLDWAVALGVPLVGAPGSRGRGTNPFPPFLPADALQSVARFTTYPEANFEEIAATGPDLILNTFTEQETHNTLAGIAPTLTLSPYTERPRTWPEVLPLYGNALDRTEQVESVLRARRDQASAARDAIAAGPLAGGTFVAGFGDSTQFVLYGRDIQPVPILADELGMQPLDCTPEEGTQEISPENLGQIDADAIFVTSNPPEGGFEPDVASQGGLRSAPLWQRLRAVQSGRVFDFPVDLVFGGPFADRALLDLLTRQLT